MEFKGIAGSKGIAAGKAYIFKRNQLPEVNTDIAEEDVDAEVYKLEQGIKISKAQLLELKELVLKEFGKEKAAIFDAHIMMLEDPELEAKVKEAIVSGKVTAAHAVNKTVELYVSVFEQIEDEYMRERTADILDVGSRLIGNITGAVVQGLDGLSSTVILVAHDLAPSDTALIDKRRVLGLVTDVGGGTSHTAILARSLEIPAVLGLGNISGQINDGDYIIIDGLEGKVIVEPDEQQKAKYRKKAAEYEEYKETLSGRSYLPAITTDGRKVEIAANIGTSSDIEGVLKIGGDGVGLFRTEFLYMNGVSLPTEEEQYLEYKKVSERFGEKPVIIRTLDIGGDKKLPYLSLPEEMNPFLGWRAIRLCLDRRDIFKTQLRAILRASTGGNILIMFPMISGVSEVREAKKVLEEAKAELRKENLRFDESIKVGIMVEIPSAAIAEYALTLETPEEVLEFSQNALRQLNIEFV